MVPKQGVKAAAATAAGGGCVPLLLRTCVVNHAQCYQPVYKVYLCLFFVSALVIKRISRLQLSILLQFTEQKDF